MELLDARVVAFDLETTDLDPHDGEILGASVSWDGGAQSIWLPLHPKLESLADRSTQLTVAESRGIVEQLFADPSRRLVGHNIKFDLHFCANKLGLIHQGSVADTKVAAFLIDENDHLDLKHWSERRLDEKMVDLDELMALAGAVLNKKRGVTMWDVVDVCYDDLVRYAEADARQTLKLYEALGNDLRREKLPTANPWGHSDLWEWYDQVECPITKILFEMEHRGICIDEDALAQLAIEVESELGQLEARLQEISGIENLRSAQQVADYLFGKLGYRPLKKSKKTGQPSVDADTLKELQLQKDTEFLGLLLKYRDLEKQKGTYVEGIGTRLKNGKLHCTFNQTGAKTGRFSCLNPNLQNQKREKRYRRLFVGEPYLMVADLSQAELRTLAHFSGDESLVRAYLTGADIHQETLDFLRARGAKVERVGAKVVNFSMPYGIQAPSLTATLKYDYGVTDITEDEVQSWLDGYEAKYTGFVRWREATEQTVTRMGYVRTIAGRKRRLPEAASSVEFRRQRAYRQAVNARIQGSVADIMKVAMINLDKGLRGLADLRLQVHDEVVLNVQDYDDALEEYAGEIIANAVKLRVPMESDAHIARSWGDAK